MIERVTGRGAVAASVYPGSRSQLHSSAIGCACGLLLLTTGPAFSQAFPAKPIRLVIPFAVGGSSDANARIIMPALTERWKQQIVLDPRPGAGTVIGTDLVAKSAPDGHTLLLTSNLFTNAPITYAKLPYDPHTDLVPITLVTISPHAIVAHPSLPARNARELIALAKARPRQMNMGNTGSPLATYNFNMLAKVSVEPIPYKGAGPLMTDLLGGHIPLAIAAISSVQSAVKSGRARIIGVGSLTPSVLFPEAPVIADGLPGFESVSWFGLMAPKGAARELVQRIRNDVATVLQQPDIRQRMLEIGGEPVGNAPEEFEARVRKEIAMWRQVAEVANIKPQ